MKMSCGIDKAELYLESPICLMPQPSGLWSLASRLGPWPLSFTHYLVPCAIFNRIKT
jgi:hypothetical protein